MAVVLKNEEFGRPGEQARKLHLIPGEQGKTAETETAQLEFPYYDLYEMYSYIAKELGIK